ncbi:MAG: thioredoxin [Clostridia bacterium]|nr:thioredoxin [Clostridia bacterium]
MAKEVRMMVQEGCPHCARAKQYMHELEAEHPEYKDVHFEIIDELKEPKLAESLDYWYVPTYFIDGRKIHEGSVTKSDVESVYKAALS